MLFAEKLYTNILKSDILPEKCVKMSQIYLAFEGTQTYNGEVKQFTTSPFKIGA